MRKIDRLLQYLKYKGISENKATQECGLAQGLLHQAKSGKADLGYKSIDKLLIKYTDLNRTWLLTGEGDMLNADAPASTGSGDRSVIERLLSQLEEKDRQIAALIELLKK